VIKNSLKYINIFFLIFIFSCQPIDKVENVVFDYNQFSKVNINAKQKIVNTLYQTKYIDPYIDHSLSKSPKDHLKEWFEANIKINGNQNLLEINIIEASLKKTEISNTENKKYKEKTIFFYEIILLVEFVLYDDTNFLLANVLVESKRTTTSGKFISLFEYERIIDNLILEALFDFTNESKTLIKEHMINYVF
tara:strand:+ start:534 stop:1112 length:579 start_codon:yes stop_codon:yes gene_type:complete